MLITAKSQKEVVSHCKKTATTTVSIVVMIPFN